MAFIPASQTAMAELRYAYGSVQAENTLYFQGSAAMSITLMQQIAEALVTWWTNNVRPNVSNAVGLREVYMTDLTTATGPTFSRPVVPNVLGSVATEGLPFNCSLAISFRSANRGRSGRGRNYMPGLAESTVSGNTVVSTVVTGMQSAYAILLGAGTFVPGAQWVIVSRFSGNVPRATALVQPVQAVVIVDATVDSMRRRLPGRGK